MKILYLTNIPAPYRVDFFNELGKLCDLTVLYEMAAASDRDDSWNQYSAQTFREIYLNGRPITSDGALSGKVIAHLKGKKQYDAIVIGGYSTPTAMLAILYMKLHKISFILNCDGGMAKNDQRIKFAIKKFFISSASAWLSSARMADSYLVHYGADERNIHRYPFTSMRQKEILQQPLDIAGKMQYKEKLGVQESKMILSIGQFIPRNGYDVLLRGSEKFDLDTGIYLVGGVATQEYLGIVAELGLKNVHFVGFKNKEQLREYYLAADVFVLPTREDIWGLVINEAMALGLPIVTTTGCVAGMELIQDGENGFLVPVDDTVALCEKTMQILDDDQLRSKMAQNNLEKIGQYTIEAMAQEHVKIFKEIVEG